MIGAIIGGVAGLIGTVFGTADNRAALEAQAQQAESAVKVEEQRTLQAQLENQNTRIQASSTQQLAKIGLVSVGVLAFGAVSTAVVFKL